MTTHVLVVDDHTIIRDMFAELFEKMPGYELVGGIDSAEHAEMFCAQKRPQLVLMDVCTNGEMSGLAAAERLVARFPLLKVIVMSGFDEISYSSRARQAGASAFALKTMGMDDFATLIEAVMAGERVFPDPRETQLPPELECLTLREREVIRLLCLHKSRREIAAELYISEATVKRHVANILTKTGFTDSVELSFHLITQGWINPRY